MRLAVRHQLSALLIVSTSIGLTTLAVATWLANHDFVLKVARDGMETAASTKAVGIAIGLDLMYSLCLYLTASATLQTALDRYNQGFDTKPESWDAVTADMTAALSSVGSLRHAPGVQLQLRSRWIDGPLGTASMLNITGNGNSGIELPYNHPNGTPVYLGEGGTIGEELTLGYPASLYPNLTILKTDDNPLTANYLATYNGMVLGFGSNLVLGPMAINESFSLLSMTLPVIENNSYNNVLGWLTVVSTSPVGLFDIEKSADKPAGPGCPDPP